MYDLGAHHEFVLNWKALSSVKSNQGTQQLS